MLSRQEKEKLVIQLLEEEKSQREISKIAKVNFTFISNVRKKLEGNDSQPSLRIQAYQYVFRKEEPINVSITLDMPYVETIEVVESIYRITTKASMSLLRIRNELGMTLYHFLMSYKEMKRNDITIDEMWERA